MYSIDRHCGVLHHAGADRGLDRPAVLQPGLYLILVIVARTLMFGDPVAGWPSTLCVILLLSGIQLFCLGLLGEYLSKTYLEVKKRPIYLCRETNLEEEDGTPTE